VSHWSWYACVAALLTGCSGPELVLGGGGDSGCVPGFYEGTFECVTGVDGSVPSSAGPFSLKLEGDMGGKSLNVAPGAKIVTAQQGATSTTDLSGTLDCTTNKLTGALKNVTSSSAAFTVTIKGMGKFSARYDATQLPPALVDGVLDPPAVGGAGIGSLAGTCTWTATLH
jgi:hypothetical protein